MEGSSFDETEQELRHVSTAIADVLAGYDTLEQRVEDDIRPIVHDLRAMHERHDREMARGSALIDTDGDTGSIQGAVNRAVVTLRDWVCTLDSDALPFIRDGEERLLSIYDTAISECLSGGRPTSVLAVLERQRQEIATKVMKLPSQ